MNQDATLNEILSTAIATAMSHGWNAVKAAEEAAEAYHAGLAAFKKAAPAVEGTGLVNGQVGGTTQQSTLLAAEDVQRHRSLTETAAAIDRIENYRKSMRALDSFYIAKFFGRSHPLESSVF